MEIQIIILIQTMLVGVNTLYLLIMTPVIYRAVKDDVRKGN